MIGKRVRSRAGHSGTGHTRPAARGSFPSRRPFARIFVKSTPILLTFGLGLVLLPLVGCQRKAPGPDECHELAVRWVEAMRGGGPRVNFGTRRLHVLGHDEAVLERTTTCLTTPYDRELVACVQARGAVVQCYQAFE